jgi:cytochrome P450
MLATQRVPSRQMISDNDPPSHTLYRGIAFTMFAPRRLREYEVSLRDVVNGLIDAFIDRGEVDFVAEFANWVPKLLFCDILGIPRAMGVQLKTWSAQLSELVLTSPFATPERRRELYRGVIEFNNFLAETIESRWQNPGTDVISELTQVEIEAEGGRRLDLTELVNMVRLLIMAANTTPVAMLGSTMLLLLRHPDEMEAVRGDRSRILRMFEESLRVESPAQWVTRTAVADAEIGGVLIPKGSQIVILLGAANRDPAVFDDPDEFRHDRENVKAHLGFGTGPHSCIGAPLARLIAFISFETIFQRMSNIRLAEGKNDFHYVENSTFRSLKSLHIEFDRT